MVKALLGLTGGIGSGKTTVGAMLAARGALVIDADLLAREVVAPGTPGLAAIQARWGDEMLQADGTLDRPALAAIVFHDPDERKALEAITHPAIVAESARLLAESDAEIGVHMAALLLESGASGRCDAIWVVTAPEELRIDRVMARDGAQEAQIRERMEAQMAESDRRKWADRVIWTDVDKDELEFIIDAAWTELVEAVRSGSLEHYRRAEQRGPQSL
ncbi:MAG: dephospho-CoA kinase [bacterium]